MNGAQLPLWPECQRRSHLRLRIYGLAKSLHGVTKCKAMKFVSRFPFSLPECKSFWEREVKELIPQGIHQGEQVRHDSVERNGNKSNSCIWVP